MENKINNLINSPVVLKMEVVSYNITGLQLNISIRVLFSPCDEIKESFSGLMCKDFKVKSPSSEIYCVIDHDNGTYDLDIILDDNARYVSLNVDMKGQYHEFGFVSNLVTIKIP